MSKEAVNIYSVGQAFSEVSRTRPSVHVTRTGISVRMVVKGLSKGCGVEKVSLTTVVSLLGTVGTRRFLTVETFQEAPVLLTRSTLVGRSVVSLRPS